MGAYLGRRTVSRPPGPIEAQRRFSFRCSSTPDYTDNRHPDDFLVRWSDGEVSMYPDADETGLNREITLVYPPA
ncbi:hypothetical protein ACFVRD_37515 [Streptomyces sp. NPDC057908]|uniref:hypothetical protein n=1 Tax=Streptomyces sp. NPDC057908 TaxID=3346276 RepID=UPI0036EE43D9